MGVRISRGVQSDVGSELGRTLLRRSLWKRQASKTSHGHWVRFPDDAQKELWCKCGVSRWTENPEVTVRLRMVPQTNKKEVK